MAGLGDELAIWRGDSGVTDLTVNGYNGTYQGGMGVVDSGGIDVYSFDGTNDCLQTPNINLSLTNAITITGWIWQSAFTNNDKVAWELSVNTGASFLGAYLNTNSGSPATGLIQCGLRGNVGYSAASASRPTTSAWHFYCAIYDKSKSAEETELFLDGAKVSSMLSGLNFNNSNNFGNVPLFIGSRNNASLFFAGLQNDIHVYDRALTTDEITELYTGGQNYDRPTFNPAWAAHATQVVQ